MSDRRSFLRNLVTLPLIGGGVTLIGQPTAAAMPVTLGLAEAYLGWLRLEHCKLMHEIIDRPDPGSTVSWVSHAPQVALPRSSDLVSVVSAGPASCRAAVMLSAAGVDLALADTSACAGLPDKGAKLYLARFDPFGAPRDDHAAYDAYHARVMNKTGPLLL